MTPAQWRLARRIPEVLVGELGLSEQQLADRLGASRPDIHAAVGMLVGRRKIDRAGEYLVPANLERPA